MEIEVEVSTLVAIADAITNGENDPTDYAMAIQGVANRLKKIGEKVA